MLNFKIIKDKVAGNKDYGYVDVLHDILNEESNKEAIDASGCVIESVNATLKAMRATKVPVEAILAPVQSYVDSQDAEDADITASDMLFILSLTPPNAPVLEELFNDSGASREDIINALVEIHAITPSVYNTVVKRMMRVRENAADQANDFACLTDLTEQVKKEPVRFIGREDLIDQTILILKRKLKHNVLHVGEPGVGKTACTLGLAQRIVEGNVPDSLKDMKVYSLDVAVLMAGTAMRGAMEEAITKVLKYVSSSPSILFIDEIHTITGGKATGSPMDIAGILKPYLSGNTTLRVIGTTTNQEYRKYIEQDKALARRFQVVDVREPSVSETVDILKGLKTDFEEYHGVKYSAKAITTAAELSATYIRGKFLPDKAIDILDMAGAKKSLAGEKSVDVDTVRQMVAETTGMPIGKTINNNDRLKTLEINIENRVFGQSEAVKEIVRCVKMSKAGLTEDNKPIASFLFVGPTGVGKTEVAKTLADELDVALLRFDMSEYADKMSVSKFIGASAGYVGYDDGGLLVNKVRENPYSVLLLDEIEKADPQIFNALLQVMDNATLTDNKGNVADFRNVVIIMTSNAGAREIKKKSLGFNTPTVQIDRSAMDNAVKSIFTPEFRGRLTSTVSFNEINAEMAEKIANKQLEILLDKLRKKKVTVEYDQELIKKIVSSSGYEQSGGRAIVSTVDEKIKPLFVDELLFGSLKNGGKAEIKVTEESAYVLEIVTV